MRKTCLTEVASGTFHTWRDVGAGSAMRSEADIYQREIRARVAEQQRQFGQIFFSASFFALAGVDATEPAGGNRPRGRLAPARSLPRGIRRHEYSVVQTANPTGWKWTVQLDETRTKVGSAFSRASAILFAERTIEKAARLKTAARNDA
jgi:hypothetical protein